jgi:hypothetical protein
VAAQILDYSFQNAGIVVDGQDDWFWHGRCLIRFSGAVKDARRVAVGPARGSKRIVASKQIACHRRA